RSGSAEKMRNTPIRPTKPTTTLARAPNSTNRSQRRRPPTAGNFWVFGRFSATILYAQSTADIPSPLPIRGLAAYHVDKDSIITDSRVDNGASSRSQPARRAARRGRIRVRAPRGRGHAHRRHRRARRPIQRRLLSVLRQQRRDLSPDRGGPFSAP